MAKRSLRVAEIFSIEEAHSLSKAKKLEGKASEKDQPKKGPTTAKKSVQKTEAKDEKERSIKVIEEVKSKNTEAVVDASTPVDTEVNLSKEEA